jgi:FMN-dependent NADH-azoreductase
MGTLLYIQASPRKHESFSTAVAEAFLKACRARLTGDSVETLNVFEADLPSFDGPRLAAKYTILHGHEPTSGQKVAWNEVVRIIDQFKVADRYVFSVPMWNFGIPYRLKQYFDLLVQPGYTFKVVEKKCEGLLTGRRAMLALSRGEDYSDPVLASQVDFQERYLRCILGFMGITDVRSVVVQPTISGGSEISRQKLQEAIQNAQALAADF